jgi:uncharacterized protein (DUF983 family)
MTDAPTPAQPSIVKAGFKGLCPRCGADTLFNGPIRFASYCRACGLDYDSFNVGDGPAAFLTLIVGALVCIAAIVFELSIHPPWWLHILIWVPITIGLVVASLRIGKGLLIASEYRNRAQEGRLVQRDSDR